MSAALNPLVGDLVEVRAPYLGLTGEFIVRSLVSGGYLVSHTTDPSQLSHIVLADIVAIVATNATAPRNAVFDSVTVKGDPNGPYVADPLVQPGTLFGSVGLDTRTALKLYQTLGRNWPGQAGIPVVMGAPPTVTLSAGGAATTVAGSAMRGLNTGSNVYVPNRVTWGGAPVSAAASIFWVQGIWTEEGGTYTYVDYVTDSPKHEVVLTGNGQYYRVSVNGQLCLSAGTLVTADGNTYRLLIDFAGVRAQRRITVEFGGAVNRIQGIQLLPTDNLMPAPKRGPKVLVIGDSFTESTTLPTLIYDPLFGFPQILSQITGWDCWPLGEGGTGYLQTNGGRTKAAGHLNDIINNAPDIVLWALGINDSAFTGAQIQAEATADYAAVAAALPGVPQIVLGPFWGSSGGGPLLSATWLLIRNAIQAAAAAAGLPFADPMGTGYLYGTGKVGSTNGVGPSDFLVGTDGTHPSQAGHNALAQAIASTIAAVLRG